MDHFTKEEDSELWYAKNELHTIQKPLETGDQSS